MLSGIVRIGICLLVLSCKSGPPPEKSPPAPVVQDPNSPADQATLDALASAQDQAEEARNRAFDFDSFVYLPKETDAADSQYVLAGSRLPVNTLGEAQEAITLYTAAAREFNRVFERVLPLYMQILWDEIAAAREEALPVIGLSDQALWRFDDAEELKADAVQLYEEKNDYYTAAATAIQVLDIYRAITVLALVWDAQQEIAVQNFGQFDPQGCADADIIAENALESYDAGYFTEAQDKAEEALLRYQLVLDNAWRVYAGERREAAQEEREVALALKANIAARNGFIDAENLYTEADNFLLLEQNETAADLFFQAEYLFSGASITTLEKRQIAQSAIEAAEAQTAASEVTVQNAEKILKGGNR
jgi:hypothetical protein